MDSTKQLGTPQSFIVIAIELQSRSGGPASDASRAVFAGLLGSGLAHACTLQAASRPDGSWASTALIPDTGQTLALLRRLENVQQDFHARQADDHARFLVHYGLAFATRPGHEKSYIGSAIRAAHTHLARLPAGMERGASTEFLLLAQSWRSGTIHFQELPPPHQHLGLHGFSLEWGAKEDRPAEQDCEAALHDYLAAQLAGHMGPFAQVLVDSARMSAKSLEDFIEETSREIDDLAVRLRFKRDALAFLQSLGGRSGNGD